MIRGNPSVMVKKVDPAGMFPKLDQAHLEKFMGNKSHLTEELPLNLFGKS